MAFIMETKIERLTLQFKEELINRLSNIEAINNSIKEFELIHFNGTAIGLEYPLLNDTLFDEKGNWNRHVNVDENGCPDMFEMLCRRIDDILYPNLLSEEDQLTFKEKMVLCALVYEIQTQCFSTGIPAIFNFNSTQAVQELQHLRELIYTAAQNAVRSVLPYLAMYLMTTQLNQEVASNLHSKERKQVSPEPSSLFNFFSFFFQKCDHSREEIFEQNAVTMCSKK